MVSACSRLDRDAELSRPGIVRSGSARWPALGTTKGSNMFRVTDAVPTTIIVAGLALAVLEILLLVLVGIIVAKLASGGRPASLPTLIGYLIAMPLVPLVAGLWGAVERSRWGPAVVAVAGLVAAVLVVRLHEIWAVI